MIRRREIREDQEGERTLVQDFLESFAMTLGSIHTLFANHYAPSLQKVLFKAGSGQEPLNALWFRSGLLEPL
jgi:hypothetical protein